jgi:hypothetical protein
MARRGDFKVVLSGKGKVQPDFPTPMLPVDLDTAWKMTSDSYPNVVKEINRILDCRNQDLVAKELLRRIMRFDFDYEADPQLINIHLAYVMSLASAPTGTPANQTWVFTRGVGVTAGYWKIGIPVGSQVKWTALVPWNVTAANLKRTIENMAAIGRNNTTVVFDGTARTWTVTLVGNLARAELAVPSVNSTGLTGGVVVPTEGAAGVQLHHAIDRFAGYQSVAFGLICGFENSPAGIFPKAYKSVIANSYRFAGSHADPSVTANIGVVGSGDVTDVPSDYVLPACKVFRAARFKDCVLIIDGVNYSMNDLWRNFEWTGGNAAITDDDAYTSADEDIHRAERADVRPFSLNIGILGVEGDDVHSLGESMAEVPVSLQIGRNNNGTLLTIPKASISLRDPAISYDGTAKRTMVNLNIEHETPSDGSSPFSILAYLGQTETLLTPSV